MRSGIFCKFSLRAAAALSVIAVLFAAIGFEPEDAGLPGGSASFENIRGIASASVASDSENDPDDLLNETDGDSDDMTADDDGSSGSPSAFSPPSGSGLPEGGESGGMEENSGHASADSGESDTSGGTSTESGGKKTDDIGEDTAVGADADEEYFTTSIVDGESVRESEYSFTITHLRSDLTVKNIKLILNGGNLAFSQTIYLAEGENHIRIAVSYTDENGKVISVYRDYTVYLRSGESSESDESYDAQPQLVTDLTSCTIAAPQIDFTVSVSGGAENVKISVYCGLTKLSGIGDIYTADLELGLNSIRIKASYSYQGEDYEENAEFSIKRIAETTPETEPYLAYQNVPSSVRGNVFTLDLDPRDYSGGRLYYNNLTVVLNNSVLKYKWSGEYVSYLLNLSDGVNSLDIRVTDNEGRFSDYSYEIECFPASDGEVIAVAVLSVDADVLGLGNICSAISVEIRQGQSAAEAIVTALEENGVSVTYSGDLSSGFYLSRLTMDGRFENAVIAQELYNCISEDPAVSFSPGSDPDSLGERDYTTLSGWLFCVNGHYLSYGASDLNLSDGDTVQLRFSLAAGKDLEGYSNAASYPIAY